MTQFRYINKDFLSKEWTCYEGLNLQVNNKNKWVWKRQIIITAFRGTEFKLQHDFAQPSQNRCLQKQLDKQLSKVC